MFYNNIEHAYLSNIFLKKDVKALKTNIHLVNASHNKPKKSTKMWYMSCKI